MHETVEVIGRIVEQNLGVYRASPSRLQEDVSQESQVASDYRGRLVYELLQNADDAMADSATASDRVSFLVTDDELWIANTGRALTDDDVLGLCGLGASSKVDVQGNRRATIGHKGLGFKSVLEVTDEPSVYSSTTSFTLGARNARPRIEALWDELGLTAPKGVPAMRFPTPVTGATSRWAEYQADGFNTAFCFPFRDSLDAEHRTAVGEILLGLPVTTVLFLKHLERIDVRVVQGSRAISRTWRVQRERWDDAGTSWSAVTGFDGSGIYRVTVTDGAQTATFLLAHDDEVTIGECRAGLTGPAWDGVDLTEVSVAAPAGDTAEVPESWRRFHVFLPTTEASPYPLLVNGAFATDLSRQHVRVSEDPDDYNAHLIRRAATLVCSQLIPMIRPQGVEAVLRLFERSSGGDDAGAAVLLHRAISDELAERPLIPTERGNDLTLRQAVLPSALLDSDGELFRRALSADARWEEREFPDAVWCIGRWARILADHGARELTPADTLSAGARCNDPVRSRSIDHESGGFELDPLLELATALWTRSGIDEREELEIRARQEPLFPIDRRDDRTLDRVALANTPAFFPPQSARTAVALPDVRFMSHALCWGALNKRERTELLDDRMNAWTSLFGVREFRFETVVQTAVLPALVLRPDADSRQRLEGLQTLDAVATICRLAGRFAKPDRPLRYQRLQSDRALLNLSRLPIPCRTATGQREWMPAYRVYFGDDWIGEDSVERLHGVLPADSGAEFSYVAPPEEFFGRLEGLSPGTTSNTVDEDDEVDVDEDADEAIESSERDRWIAFLSWIGVNQSLRPVHFHDVEDDATGWLTTKDLAQPNGWAFSSLGTTWGDFAAALRSRLERQHDLSQVNPYLYEAHDLDQIVAITEAAADDATCAVARAFFDHLIRHWPRLSPFADCTVALVESGKWPSQRSKPQRALAEELADGGDNLWVHRLRSRSICPTRLGPRQPGLTWRPTAELDRRFGRRGRTSATLLPVLEVADGSASNAVRGICERLGVRAEPSPSTFTADDAYRLCVQLQVLFPGTIDASDLREVIKPVYRQLFELLSGHSSTPGVSLREAPLLANTGQGPRFLPVTEVLYASTPGIRERSGVAGAVSTFVLEAEASATAPLRTLFGIRFLEEALEWQPNPGESSLDPVEIEAMRVGLRELVPTLLARIRTERSAPADARTLRAFVDKVEPVERLTLACSLDGEPIVGVADRPYFVRVGTAADDMQAFVVWNGADGWPPTPESAQGLAMALADALGINLVETFLAFIQSDAEQRLRLLDFAGGSGLLAEVTDELADTSPHTDEQASMPTPTAGVDEASGETPSTPPDASASAAPPIPLLRFDELTIDGQPVLVTGAVQGKHATNGGHGTNNSENPTAGRRAAAGTDLGAMDSLGMQIAISYEVLRLRTAGHTDATADLEGAGSNLIVDVHSPATIRAAVETSSMVGNVMTSLEALGISQLYPGFDILTIVDGRPERLIELKSSGVDAHIQVMSWNEWKTAKASQLRSSFWLYLVGNLRADLPHALPYVRAIHDPFGTLVANEFSDHQVRRAVQLRVREFKHAEHLELGVAREKPDG